MKFLVANWKMNGDIKFAENFVKEIDAVKTKNRVVICPPFPLLHKFQKFSHFLGAQNCSSRESGAFTGEVSPLLLKELGCKYVIIGHSERRVIFNESDEMIFEKYQLLTKLGITPIICVGEKSDERKDRRKILSNQLAKLKNDEMLSNAVIAYEPVWCIGSGETPTSAEIAATLRFIKEETFEKCPVLYGGSVNLKNTNEIMNTNSVDGVLVGGASLKIEEFSQMIRWNE